MRVIWPGGRLSKKEAPSNMEQLRTDDIACSQVAGRACARAALSCLLAARGKPPLTPRHARGLDRQPRAVEADDGPAGGGEGVVAQQRWRQAAAAAVVQRKYRKHVRTSIRAHLSIVRAFDRCVVGPACSQLGRVAQEQLDDPQLARQLLRKGALNGDAEAQRRLAVLIYSGEGLKLVFKRPGGVDGQGGGGRATWAPGIDKEGGEDYAEALPGLEGVETLELEQPTASERARDLARARHLFSCAAAQADAIAINNLAVMAAHGLGGPLDTALACQCFLRLAADAERILSTSRFPGAQPPPFALFRNAALMIYHGGVEQALAATAAATTTTAPDPPAATATPTSAATRENNLSQARWLFSLAAKYGVCCARRGESCYAARVDVL